MIPLTNDTKNTVVLVQEEKPSFAFNQTDQAFEDAEGNWNNPGTPVSLESKNTVALTNEAKS